MGRWLFWGGRGCCLCRGPRRLLLLEFVFVFVIVRVVSSPLVVVVVVQLFVGDEGRVVRGDA